MRNFSKALPLPSGSEEELLGGNGQNGAFRLNKRQGRHVMYAKLLDHLAPDNLPAGEMICETGIQRTAALRQTTAEELLHLGTRQVVYLKAGTCDGEIFFVICGADGTSLVAVENLETAIGMVAEQGLIIVAVH